MDNKRKIDSTEEQASELSKLADWVVWMFDNPKETLEIIRNSYTIPTPDEMSELYNNIKAAADAIEELSRENESLAKSVNEASEILRKRWIPVTERLPESVRKSYLCLTDTGYHCEVRWTNNVYGLWTSSMDNKWGWSIADVPQYCKVTHWMPLPEPPKEET